MALAKTGTLRQLTTFSAVARLGSVTLAASELHLTQSAVSIQVGSLEQTVGSKLLLRTGRGVRLTRAGELLNSHAERVLSLWNEASEDMESFRGDFSGTLSVGAVTTAEYFLPRLLIAFLRGNPKAKVKLHVGNRDEIVGSLLGRRIDIAVMGSPPEELKVFASPFACNPVGFVAAPDHALMDNGHLTLADLSRYHILVREQGSGSRNALERLFREAGLKLRIGSELNSNESLKQMCAAGFGPAYMSTHTCVLEMDAGLLKLLPLDGNPVAREWFVIRAPSTSPPQITLAFEKFLRDEGQSQITAFIASGKPATTRRRVRSDASDQSSASAQIVRAHVRA